MYIFELIVNFIKPRKKFVKSSDYHPFTNEEDFKENPDDCNHVFLPLDNDGDYFACKNCGIVKNIKELENINIFKNKPFKQ